MNDNVIYGAFAYVAVLGIIVWTLSFGDFGVLLLIIIGSFIWGSMKLLLALWVVILHPAINTILSKIDVYFFNKGKNQ